MEDYLDFGSDSDNDSTTYDNQQIMEIDSDEDERNQNDTILKMLMEKSDNAYSKSRKDQAVEDFEAEMEAELDRRAIEVENKGGMKHQTSLSRSSSNSSLNKLAITSAAAASSSIPGPSSCKKPRRGIIKEPKEKSAKRSGSPKSVKFSNNVTKVENSSSNDLPETIDPNSSEMSGSDPSGFDEDKKRYEEVYFDSDESEGDDEVTRTTRRNNRKFVSDDDLFYDPKSDTKDQAWVDAKRRQAYSGSSSNSGQSKSKSKGSKSSADNDESSKTKNKLPPGVKPLPNSDAVLNCPACFTVLCLDCQRHDIYNNQYRAMFVMNCVVNSDEIIYAPLKPQKSKGKGKQQATASMESHNDKFNAVKCKICKTHLGVYDHDEVYHFINVLASHS